MAAARRPEGIARDLDSTSKLLHPPATPRERGAVWKRPGFAVPPSRRERTIAPQPWEAISGGAEDGDESRRTGTGSRPITHGYSTRDPRPAPCVTQRRHRCPFEGPWPTPRVSPDCHVRRI